MLFRLLILCNYLLGVLGVPGSWLRPSTISQPVLDEVAFPCQHRPCGCQSARQCWTHCCCTTPAERVLWAWTHGLTIPDYAVLPSPKEMAKLRLQFFGVIYPTTSTTVLADSELPSQQVKCRHCAKQQSNHLPNTPTTPSPSKSSATGCCSKKTLDKVGAKPLAHQPTAKPATKWLLATFQAKCLGLASDWLFGTAHQAPPIVCWQLDWLFLETISSVKFTYFSYAAAPEPPPPRRRTSFSFSNGF